MFERLWKKWTLDKPAELGDLLWEVFVVQLAALLDRVTLRQVIAFIPVVILILAYAHRIPIPPEFMLVGDMLAYIDIFSVILLLSVLGRMTALWLSAKQASAQVIKFASKVLVHVRRLELRHRREGNGSSGKGLTGRKKPDDEHPVIEGLAWA